MLGLEHGIHRRVVGQATAVKALAKAVRRARVGLKDPNRPIGSFLFLGPTGVGKTEVTRALAQELFGSAEIMTRIDMSEYGEQHSVAGLIEYPSGYVGFDQGGMLTESVRLKQYQVVLLDEIEKAHPKVWNVLLQVLDAGRLHRRSGQRGRLPQRDHHHDLEHSTACFFDAFFDPICSTHVVISKIRCLITIGRVKRSFARLQENVTAWFVN